MLEATTVWWTAIAAIGAGVLLAVALYQPLVRRHTGRIRALEQDMQQLNSTVSALCSSAVGVDRRVTRMEQRGRDMALRQEALEQRKTGSPPYTEAIHLAKQGAAPERLVDELGLSPSEATLVAMLHGMKAAS